MTLKVHHLRPAPGAHKAKTRVGRGEGSKGKTAGRGTKGTKARYQVPEAFEGGQMPLHMRTPKLKGFKNPFRTEYQVVNLDRLSSLFPDGGEVDPDVLAQLGNLVQHALRAYTPDDAKALKAAVSTFPRSNYDLEELLTTLGIGEAVITVLSETGAPTPVASPSTRSSKFFWSGLSSLLMRPPCVRAAAAASRTRGVRAA